MNQDEREILSRLMGLTDSVPVPRVAMSSEAIHALVIYPDDVSELTWAVRKVCEALCLTGHPELEEGADFLNATKVLDAYEAWLEQRKQEEWATAQSHARDFYDYEDTE